MTWGGVRRDAAFLLFAAPFACLTAVFGIWPIILSVRVSFAPSAAALRPDPGWAGWANYVAVLADPAFTASMLRTLGYTLGAVVLNLFFALAYALLLDHPALGRMRALCKLAVFLPVVTPDVAGYAVWRWLFDQSFGAINAALALIGVPEFGGLASPTTAIPAVMLAELWHHSGFYVVIFLANLAIRDRALTEAASMDGASAWQRFVHVTLPQLRPALTVNTVYALIQFLKTFTVVVVMTKGGPADATNFVSYYAYQLFDAAEYGQATAVATMLFGVVGLVALSAFAAADRYGSGRGRA